MTRSQSDYTIRAVYRTRYGIGDRNGNLVLDQGSEYAPGHMLLHATARRHVGTRATISFTARNLTNRRYPETIPSLSGRLIQLRLDLNL